MDSVCMLVIFCTTKVSRRGFVCMSAQCISCVSCEGEKSSSACLCVCVEVGGGTWVWTR